MKYKINGKEIELLKTQSTDIFNQSMVDKYNELIQALGEPVEEKPAIKAPFYSKFTGSRLGYRDITVTLGEDETWEEPKKWDMNNLKQGDMYWYIGSDGYVCYSQFYEGDTSDIWRQKTNNCFKTRGEAENYKQKLINENK